MPTSEYDSDQQCVKASTKVCMLRKSYANPNDNITIGVKCINQCQYSLKIHTLQLNSLGTNTTSMKVSFDGRSVSAFSYQIPMFAADGTAIDYV